MSNAAGRRILHIAEAASAGVGRHVLDLAQGQLTRGHEVTVIYSGRRVDDAFLWRASSTQGLRAHRIDMRRAPHVADAAVVKGIRNYVRAHGPFDIVHGHSSKGGAVARLVGGRNAPPVVYTPHCIFTMNQQAGRVALLLTRAVEKRLARRTAAIIAVSPDEEEHILSLGIARDKVHCVINGVTEAPPADPLAAKRKLGLNTRGVVIGYLSRLSRQKNPRLLLEAFARLGRGVEVQLAIAGDGELEEPMQIAARELAIEERVHWLGHRPAAEVLPAFDVFALSSNYEGMPYVLLEALAAGLPIVATDVGGVRLTVSDGENGYIVSRPCPREFAQAMEKLIGSPDRRARFGAQSRSMATQFHVDAMVDQTIGVYEQVLSSRVLL